VTLDDIPLERIPLVGHYVPPRVVLVQRVLRSMFNEIQSAGRLAVRKVYPQRTFLVRQRAAEVTGDVIGHDVVVVALIVVQRILIVQMIR